MGGAGGFQPRFHSPRNGGTQNPPVGLSAHHHPPHRLTRAPKAARTYLHGGQGCGASGLVAVSPRCPQGWQRCPGSAGCHGRIPGWERRQRSFGGAAGREEEEKPLADPVRVGFAFPEGSRSVPGGFPEHSRRAPGSFPERRDGGAGSGGIADSGNLPELFTAPSERSFQGCNAKPPSSPCRDIHTPPAPYAACALTQEVGTGWCHLL